MFKILISTSSFNIKENRFLKLLEENNFELILNPYGRRLSENEVTDLLKNNIVGMIAGLEPLTRQVLKSSKNLKVIARCGTGIDNIDIDFRLVDKLIGFIIDFCIKDHLFIF